MVFQQFGNAQTTAFASGQYYRVGTQAIKYNTDGSALYLEYCKFQDDGSTGTSLAEGSVVFAAHDTTAYQDGNVEVCGVANASIEHMYGVVLGNGWNPPDPGDAGTIATGGYGWVIRRGYTTVILVNGAITQFDSLKGSNTSVRVVADQNKGTAPTYVNHIIAAAANSSGNASKAGWVYCMGG